MAGKWLAAVAGGFLVGMLASVVTGLPAGANFAVAAAGRYFGLITGWLVAFVMALVAPSGRRAWARILMACGLLSFAIPLATLLFGVLPIGGPMAGRVWQMALLDSRVLGDQPSILVAIAGFFLGTVCFGLALLLEEPRQASAEQSPRH